MQLAIWLVVCAIITFISVRRPYASIIVTILLFVFVPYVAGSLLTGGSTFHPASWLVFVTVGVTLLTKPQKIFHEIGRHPLAYMAIGFALVGMVGSSFVINSIPTGRTLMVDVIIAPILFFMLIGIHLHDNPRGAILMRNVILICGVIQVGISLIGSFLGGPLFYVAQLSTKYWFSTTGVTRALGTFDDPLTLALFLAACIPLLASIKRPSLQLALVVIFFSGILLTSSRTSLFLALLGVIYLMVRTRTSFTARLAIGVGAVVLVVIVFTTSIGTSVLTRLTTDDGGSSGARNDAWSLFFQIAHQFTIFGGGITSSYTVGLNGGLATSFESAIIMYSIDFGILFAVVYFGVLAVLSLRGLGKGHLPGAGLSAAFVVGAVQTFSSVGSGTAAGMFMWMFAAIATAKWLPSSIESVEEPDVVSTPEATGVRA
ncbi:hypothetical protein [Subtercola lobariae]|uniref:O-antigen ligase domain-containing protein n=1 Tax=Subtercola lobariae TaxID=1588641 RepID=A0A917B0R4_9MICO|nr:hypothetical protein [Subtercola lobariae]GGF12869.1 hypothetical protein GCM10011399_03490 [Subtercola lobariae]